MNRSDLLIHYFYAGRFVRSFTVKQRMITLGSSRSAGIQIGGLSGQQLLIERQDKWVLSSLDGRPFQSDGENHRWLELDEDRVIRFGDHLFQAQHIERFPRLFQEKSENSRGVLYQNYLIYSGEQFIESHLIKSGQIFHFRGQKLGPYKTESIDDLEVDGYIVKYQPIYLEPIESTIGIPYDFAKSSGISALVALLLIGISLLMQPQESDAEILAEVMKPKTFEIAKPKPPPPPVKTVQLPKASGSKGGAKPKTGTTTATKINNLVGKVTHRLAKNSFKIQNKGISAKKTNSGRLSAGTGQLNGGQLDSIQNSFRGIATKGGAGGRGSTDFGKVGMMGVKQAGVGVLEEETEIAGGLDREIIAQFIKSQLGQILYCYERQLSANPDLYGKIHIHFEIQGDGSVNQERVKETTLNNLNVENCILKKVAKWNFPKPEGGTRVVVTYPFLFKSTN